MILINYPYWSPTRQQYWVSYWALRLSFPNMSLPQYVDMPEIDVFQIYPVDMPEIPEGFTLEWLNEGVLNEDDGKYYQSYKFNPIEQTEE